MPVVAVERVRLDMDVYPRVSVNWMTSLTYANAMRSGSRFPPLLVGRSKGQYVVLDGAHRLDAHRRVGHEAVRVRVTPHPPGPRKATWRRIAFEANVKNGQRYSPFDVRKAILRFREDGCSEEQIARLIRLPVEGIPSFLDGHWVITRDNRTIPLKAPMNAGAASMKDAAEVDAEQGFINSRSVGWLIKELIILFQGGHVDVTGKETRALLDELDAYIHQKQHRVKQHAEAKTRGRAGSATKQRRERQQGQVAGHAVPGHFGRHARGFA